MTADEVRQMLIRQIGARSQRQFARVIGCSPTLLNDILRGLREPCGKVLISVGLKRVTDYQPLDAKLKAAGNGKKRG